MGCFCSKRADDTPSTKERDKRSSSSIRRVVSSEKDTEHGDGSRMISTSNIDIDEQSNSGQQKSKTVDIGVVKVVKGRARVPKIGLATLNESESEVEASNWPIWLASAAGDAIKGWIPRRIESFQQMGKVFFFFLLFTHEFVNFRIYFICIYIYIIGWMI